MLRAYPMTFMFIQCGALPYIMKPSIATCLFMAVSLLHLAMDIAASLSIIIFAGSYSILSPSSPQNIDISGHKSSF